MRRAHYSLPVLGITIILFGGIAYQIVGFPTELHAESGGSVTLTFDDGNASQFQYAAPLLASSAQKAVFYVNSGLVGRAGYMKWSQLATLKRDGHEIGGHTLQHVELPTVNEQQRNRQINEDFQRLSRRNLSPKNFAVPYGAYDNDTTAAVAKTYDSMRAFKNAGLNIWPYNKYLLYVRPITNTTSVNEVLSWIDEAEAENAWLVIVFHEVLPIVDPLDTYSWSTVHFETLLKRMNEKGIRAKTISEVLSRGQNLLPNGGFESNMDGWRSDAPELVTHTTANMGSYPSPRNAMQVSGLAQKNIHAFGGMIPVSFGREYGVRLYTDSRQLESGEVGFYVDEYDAGGVWISGKWLGAIYGKNVIDKAYAYTPTSMKVTKAELQIYMTAGTNGTTFIDSVEFFAR